MIPNTFQEAKAYQSLRSRRDSAFEKRPSRLNRALVMGLADLLVLSGARLKKRYQQH